jgi:hypothetical protein
MTFRTVLSLALFLQAPCMAATYPVDDSQSLPRESNTPMKWRSLAPSRAEGHAVEGANLVTVRLNLAPWMSKVGRVYLALPEQSVGPVTAEWSTQGKLLPGQLVSGNRTLVFAGPIRTAMLEDTLLLKLSADGRRLVSPQRLQFHFEIDID